MIKSLLKKITLFISALSLLVSSAIAADFPKGPVELIVPWKAGGGTDRSARIFAPFLAEELGVPVNVVNISGGGGWVAWGQMSKWDAKKDDHKIGLVNLPHVFAYLDPKMKRTETVGDFNFIGGQTYDPSLWLVRADNGRFTNGLKDVLAYTAKNPNKLLVSTTAIGSDDYQGLAFAEKKLKGFKVGKVYANNDAKKIQELLAGTTDMVAGNVSFYVNYIREGKMRPVAVLDTVRSEYLPSVPTFGEVTGVENLGFAARTLIAANGLPQDKYDVFKNAINKAQANPGYQLAEMSKSSRIWTAAGSDLKDFISNTEKMVKVVEYWNQ